MSKKNVPAPNAPRPAPAESATVPDRLYARPEEGESDEAFANRLANWGVAALEADRKRRGLPPMPE
jgi:hypothetical protein